MGPARARNGAAAAVSCFGQYLKEITRKGYKRHPGTTPNEFVDLLQMNVKEASNNPYLGGFLPPIVSGAKGLTRIYNQAIYSLHLPSKADIKMALKDWRDMRWRLWLARFEPRRKK